MIASNPVARVPVLLAASSVAASVTGTLVETTLATVTIPAGAMGPNGGVEIRTTWSYTNSANGKTLRVRLGGIAGDAFLSLANTTTNSMSNVFRIRNRGATNSQVGSSASSSTGGVGTAAAGPVTSARDMTVSQDIVFSGQLALNTETITLESYEVWLLP